MSKKKNTINERIREMIAHYNMNPNSFALKCKVLNPALSQIVGGREGTPSYITCQKILKAFPEVSAEWFMRGEGEMIRTEDPDLKAQMKDLQERYNDKVKIIELYEKLKK